MGRSSHAGFLERGPGLAQAPEYVRLDSGQDTLVLSLQIGGAADLVYLGAALPEAEDLHSLASACERSLHESQPDTVPTPGLLPERKGGWSGAPAISVSRKGQRIETDFRVSQWNARGDFVSIEYADALTDLSASLMWSLDEDGVIDCGFRVSNGSGEPLTLDRLASLVLPVPARFAQMTSYSGRWAGEMRENHGPIAPGGFARNSAIGKQGFGAGNWLLLHAPATGEVLGAHLEWSGDYDTRLECDVSGAGDGRAFLQMSAAWEPGEITLQPGETFETPGAILARGETRDDLAHRFHGHVRSCVLAIRKDSGPRKVHLNSWEALSFNLSESELSGLVESAADLGVERFVLDDGWFAGRRSDRTSLGDWFVSQDIFPSGLAPLIEHVHAKGMDFGLWVEPEMISPDSDLYRAHPNWCIHLEGHERATMRGQLVLDLTNPDAQAHIFERMLALVEEHDIAYLKWDHNRDLFPRGARGYRQTQAVYSLLKGLLAAAPGLEIESCSSGGGRIDTKILSQTHRVWPSDNNDAIERLRIIPAWNQFLPLEVLGNHVGPSPNPITGRRLSMDFRAKVALFGHMGIEADPRAMGEDERAILAAHIALYKAWRSVLHQGQTWRLEHPDPGITGMMATFGNKALALAAQSGFGEVFDAAPVRLKGLDPDALYRVTLPEPWPERASLYLANAKTWAKGLVLSGRALIDHGLALPLTHPETAWLIALEEVPS